MRRRKRTRWRRSSEGIYGRTGKENQLKGTVTEINEGAVNAIVKIDIGGGNVISATISMASVKELGLAVGKEAYAVIKATSVMVGIDD